jgi:(E)-4-hydroxy-3-methylbut-2-enyl-diphosphate synthase
MPAAVALTEIKPQIGIPLVADIHFDHNLAIESIRSGADCIRINPGNMRSRDDVAAVVRAAADAGISIRIGVNSGSIRPREAGLVKPRVAGAPPASHTGLLSASSPNGTAPLPVEGDLVPLMVDAALADCAFFDSLGFRDVLVSLKASDVMTTIAANRAFAERCDVPLHLGVTEAGTRDESTIKSSIGIGTLLAEGIGDTIRVSITGPPHDEVRVGHDILRALGLEKSGVNLVSCPTCGRCQIDLAKLVNEVKAKMPPVDRPLTVAVMGCVVNGPGEAAEADVGIAGGKGFGFVFREGKKLRKVPEERLADELVAEIRALVDTRRSLASSQSGRRASGE